MKNFAFITFLLIFFTISISVAQSPNVGTLGGSMLKIGVGARATAMGETFVAISDDVHSIYWNPSGLGQLDRPQFSAMHSEWIGDIRYEWIGFAQTFGKWVTIGADVSYLWTGEIPRTVESIAGSYEENGIFDFSDLIVRIAAGSGAYKGVRIGFAFQVARQQINFVASEAIPSEEIQWNSLNLGVIYQPPIFDQVRVGAIVKHLNATPQKYDAEIIPMKPLFQIGVAYNISIAEPIEIPDEGEPIKKPDRNTLILSADLDFSSDHSAGLHLGLEYEFANGLALRSGYRSNRDFDFLSKFSGGFGFASRAYRIDYAFVPFGDLDRTHRLSFTLDF